MPLYKIFFISCCLFTLGILIVSLELSFWYVFAATLIAIFYLIYYIGKSPVILIALFIIAGAFYYLVDDYLYFNNLKTIANSREFRGIVITDPEIGGGFQNFYLRANKNSENPNVRIFVKTKPIPHYSYGDELVIAGNIEKPPDNYYGQYLAKEKIHGAVNFPEISLLDSGRGNRIFSVLFKIKNNVRDSFNNLLSSKQAAFLTGITLGSTADFSKDLLEEFSLSGTRHIIAISGLHMAIITVLLITLLSYLMPKKYALIISMIILVAFTAMIGFKLSAIRAAIMGFVAGASKILVGRPHAAYNAIALAATFMILVNPKVLVFDIGFQLSFLAVAAIIYLAPLINYIFNTTNNAGLLKWKELLVMTISAEIATAPLLIIQFHNFSIISFIANILVLPVIPLIMYLAFLIGILSFIAYWPALIISLVTAPIIDYVLFVISLCAKLSIVYDPILNWPIILIYYAFFIYLVFNFHTSKKYQNN